MTLLNKLKYQHNGLFNLYPELDCHLKTQPIRENSDLKLVRNFSDHPFSLQLMRSNPPLST